MRYGRDTSRKYGAQLREERRAFRTEQAEAKAKSGIAETERRQVGETRRTQMKIEADKQATKKKAEADRQKALSKEGLGDKGAMTADQMAKHRTGALKQSQEKLEIMRNPVTGQIMNPATGKAMTSAQEAEFVRLEADNLLKYSLGGETAPEVEETEPVGAGWVETEDGRRFEVGGERGFREVPQPESSRLPMVPAGAITPTGGAPAAVSPPVEAPASIEAPAQKLSQAGGVADRLRREYETQQQAAMPQPLQAIASRVSKYLKGNILSRPSYSPGQRTSIAQTRTTAPLGLRGFMENRYGR